MAMGIHEAVNIEFMEFQRPGIISHLIKEEQCLVAWSRVLRRLTTTHQIYL